MKCFGIGCLPFSVCGGVGGERGKEEEEEEEGEEGICTPFIHPSHQCPRY